MPKVTVEHKEARRRQVLDAALDCFEAKGLHGTTMQDIITASGLSAGAIYTYFASKDAIIEAIADERHHTERALLEDALAVGDPLEAFRDFLARYFAWLADPDEQRRRRVNVQVWAEALHNPKIEQVITEGLAPIEPVTNAMVAAQRAGQLPAHIDPEAFSRAVLALIQGFVLQQAWEPDLSVDRFRDTVLQMVDATLGSRQ